MSLERQIHQAVDGGNTHIVFGCDVSRAEIAKFQNHPEFLGLDWINCTHSDNKSAFDEDWLVVRKLPSPAKIRSAQTIIWIPEKCEISLADQLRAWPVDKARQIRLIWPHEKLLFRFGWSWKELMVHHEHLYRSFPHLNLRPPSGWEIYNPEIPDDLSMEPISDDRIDCRRPEQKPRVSVIIPTYNNLSALKSCVEQLMLLAPAPAYEVIIADDGSTDQTWQWLRNKVSTMSSTRWMALRLSRPRERTIGGGEFRAGVARNAAARLARGEILLFLDSDILIPSDYLSQLVTAHESADLIQPLRTQLNFEADKERPRLYNEISTRTHTMRGESTWEGFQEQETDWNERPQKWKFVSTFCLSLKKADFDGIGGFRRSFFKYGCEDTDLGFRADRAGLRFLKLKTKIFHFRPSVRRAEYGRFTKSKQELLKNSAKIFFLNNLDPEIAAQFARYLGEDESTL